MKRLKVILSGIVASVFAINYVSAASVPANSFTDLNNGTITVNTQTGNNLGYVISDKFVCYGCLSEEDTEYEGVSETSSGIGIYFKNAGKWETGSFAGSVVNDPFPSYALSSFFVAMTTGEKDYDDAITNGLLTASGNTLTKNYSAATVTVTAEPQNNKNFIKLIYNVKNGATPQKVKVATFNDLYLGSPSDNSDKIEACKDNAAYESNTHIKNITNGFNAKTSGKFMSVVLEENSGLLSNGGGEFNYWVGTYSQTNDSLPSSVVVNMFGTSTLDSKPFDDSAFSYSWSKDMAANEEVTFSTLIGLGNNNPVTINIDENTISPNYDKDNKTFSLTENDANIQIGGTIKDECGMGTCTYTINGSGPIPCDENVYYTSGDSFTTNYMSTINIKEANLKTTGNEYTVTANSVACGTDTATHTFNLSGDIADNPQTGINNNYIILGLILVGGVGIFIYSKKHNKFPQV